jgi:hypothetical protein
MGEISVDGICQLSGLPEIQAVSPAVQTNFWPPEIWLIAVYLVIIPFRELRFTRTLCCRVFARAAGCWWIGYADMTHANSHRYIPSNPFSSYYLRAYQYRRWP